MTKEHKDKGWAEAEELRCRIAALDADWKETQRHLHAVASMAEETVGVAAWAETTGEWLSGYRDEGGLPDEKWIRMARELCKQLAKTNRAIRETSERLENLVILMEVNPNAKRKKDFTTEKDVVSLEKKLDRLLAGEVPLENLLPKKEKTDDETLEQWKRVLKLLSLKLEVRMRTLLHENAPEGGESSDDGAGHVPFGPDLDAIVKWKNMLDGYLSKVALAKMSVAYAGMLEPIPIPGLTAKISKASKAMARFEKDRTLAGLDKAMAALMADAEVLQPAPEMEREMEKLWERFDEARKAGDEAEVEAVRRQLKQLIDRHLANMTL